MKKIFFFILTILSLQAFSQSKLYLRGDSVYIQSAVNGELILLNGSRLNTGAYLKNTGNGRTNFSYVLDSVWVDGDSVRFRYGPTTISHAIGGGNQNLQNVLDEGFTATSDMALTGTLGIDGKLSLAHQLSSPFTPSAGFGYLYYFDDSLRFKTPTTTFTLGRGDGGSVVHQNLANTALLANGDYTHWWNSKRLKIVGFDQLDLHSDTVSNGNFGIADWKTSKGLYIYGNKSATAGSYGGPKDSVFIAEAFNADSLSNIKVHPGHIDFNQNGKKIVIPNVSGSTDTFAVKSQFLPINISDFVDGDIDDLYVTVESGDTVIKVREAPEGSVTQRFDSIQVLAHTDSLETATGNIAIINKRVWHYYDSSDHRVARRLAEDDVLVFPPEEGGEEGWIDAPATPHHGFIATIASNVYTAGTVSGGTEDMENGLCGTTRWDYKLPNGTDGGLQFEFVDDTEGNFSIGFSEKHTEQYTSMYKVGVYVGVGFYKFIDNGVREGDFIPVVEGKFPILVRESGTWKCYLSDDGVTYDGGDLIHTYDYTGSVDLYPVASFVSSGKLYHPKFLNLTDVSETPAYVSFAYMGSLISTGSNGIVKTGADGFTNSFARTTETFAFHDYVEFTHADASFKNARFGFGTATTPSNETSDFSLALAFDQLGNLYNIVGGSIGGSATYTVGDKFRVYASGVLKKSSDGGSTWVTIRVGNGTALTGTQYGIGTIYFPATLSNIGGTF